METCTTQLIVKTMIKQETNIELTFQMCIRHVTLCFANCEANIFQTSVGN